LEEEIIKVGIITHFFSKINVAVVDLTESLTIGETIFIKGPKTDFEQTVESMQIEHKNIENAKAGESIGLKLLQRAREKDTIYKKIT
jgi:putative protease